MLPRIYDGSGKPAPERVTLRAGKLTLEFEAGTLRYIRLGKHEIVRSIYAAVRDHNWGTVPAELCDLNLDIGVDSFAISFTSDHRQGDIHFAWRGVIVGTADSTITFSFNGEALTGFKRNRIGFCVLHPMDVSGKAVAVEHVDGVTEQGVFPQLISPHQPFFNIRALTHEVIPGVRAEVRMEGDTFEMEDQRNWIDASFKTYCTPLTAREIDRLRIVLSGDLRVEIDFSPGWEARLEQAKQEASALATRLFIVVFLADDDDRAEAQLSALAAHLGDYELLSSLLALREGETTTSAATFELMRARFDPHPISLCAGTNGYFTQLNRNRPLGFQPDVIVYSVNPQVHAFDNASLIETLAALETTVATARSFAQDAKIAVTPVTFKIRQNPDATAPEPPTPPGQLPRRVDPRQMSLFGAGWAMGAIAALALAGVDSLTFFETTGWLGLMERPGGSPLPDLFPSIPGGVFPLYHVFADVAEFAGGQVMSFTASHPLNFTGLALRRNAHVRLLVANHTQTVRTLTITGVSGSWMLKTLDEHTADFSMIDPEGYRAAPGKPITANADGLTLELLPYAVARLDQGDAS